MSIYKGVNATKVAANIPFLTEEGQYGGKDRRMYDTFILTADLAAGDTILLGSPLPEGATLLDFMLTTGALGGSCTLNAGWQAGATGLETAQATGFLSAAPVSSAGVTKAHGSAYEGGGGPDVSTFYRKVLQEQVQPVIACQAVSSGATGKKVSMEIIYIVD